MTTQYEVDVAGRLEAAALPHAVRGALAGDRRHLAAGSGSSRCSGTSTRETTSRTLASPRSSGTSNAACGPGRSSSCTTSIPGRVRALPKILQAIRAPRPARRVRPGAARDRSACAAASDARTIRPREAHRRDDRARRRRRRRRRRSAARLPGVKTPTRNISCFYVPIKPTARGNLLCNIKTSLYSRAAAERLPGAGGPRLARLRAAHRRQGAAGLHRWSPLRHRPRHADVRRARLRPHVAFARLHVHVARHRAHVHERARARPVPVARVVPALVADASSRARAGRRPSRAGGSAAPRRSRRAPPPAAARRCTSTTSRACTRR